jgi:hypothetical protein
MMTATARGAHFYYQIEEGQEVQPRVKVNGTSLAVRGEGSYCVASPSIHPETGEPYRCVGSWNLDEVPYFDPAWVEAIERAPGVRRCGAKSIRRGPAYISCIRAVSGNGGHNATFRAACVLRDSGMTPDEALVALVEWNTTNAQPPWTLQELQHKVRAAFEL